MTVEDALLKAIPNLGIAAPIAFVAWLLLQRLLTILAEDRAQNREMLAWREKQMQEREAQMAIERKTAAELETAKLSNLEAQTKGIDKLALLLQQNTQATENLRREVERGVAGVRESLSSDLPRAK